MIDFHSLLAKAGIIILINMIALFFFSLRRYRIKIRKDIINNSGYLPEELKKMDGDDLDERIKRILSAIIAKQGWPPLPLIEINMSSDILSAIRKHYGLPNATDITLRFEETGDAPASIQRQDVDSYLIRINPSNKEKFWTHKALIAHECAHIWADKYLPKQLCDNNPERDIDVLAVMLGAGPLIFGGVKQLADIHDDIESVSLSIKTEKLGYLTLVEFAYVVAVYVHFLGINSNEILKFLPPISKRAYYYFSRNFLKTPECIQLNKSQIIIECNYCLQKLRIDRNDGKEIVAICPICKTKFSIKTRSKSTGQSTRSWLRIVRAALPNNAAHEE